MELAWIVFQQTITMFLLMAVGFFLYKKGIITKSGSGELSKTLIYLVIPAIIIKSYMVDFSAEKMHRLGWATLATVIALALSMLICHFLYKDNRKIENFGNSFSNAGFVGIPLVSAVLGTEAVFYVSVYVALLNILQQTYGVMIMTGKKESIQIKNIIQNPVLIAFVLGLLLFFLPISIPTFFQNCIGYVANLNTPIAMIVLGIYLAQTNPTEIFCDKRLYAASMIRLLVIPTVTLLMLTIFLIAPDIRMVVLIASATPIGSNVAVFAQLNGLDSGFATKLVCNSTVLSIITLPIIVGAAHLVW